MKKKEHNGKISFWKFMFSLLIVITHLGSIHQNIRFRFASGSIGVDFFFIVSGYLFCKKCLKIKITKKENIGKMTFDFAIQRIQKFIPYILFTIFLSLLPAILLFKLNINDFISAIFNILYIPIHNNKVYDIYGLSWYIFAMIIIETLIYPFLTKYKKNYIYIISPIIIYLTGNYLLIKYGTFATPWDLDIFCYKGVIRAIFGINIGIFLFELTERIKLIKITKLSQVLLTLIELFGYLSIFIVTNATKAHYRFDLLMVIILAICIMVSFSNKAYFSNSSNNKIFYYLEKISLPLYLNQWLVIETLEYYIEKYSININFYLEYAVIILILFIISIIELTIIKLYENNKYKIKKLFIEA